MEKYFYLFTKERFLKLLKNPKYTVTKVVKILYFFTFSLFQKIRFFPYRFRYKIFKHPSHALEIVAAYIPKNPIVLEAGAYLGAESIGILNFWKDSNLHSFEPIPENYNYLVNATKEYKNIKTYNLALGDKVEKTGFYVSSLVENSEIPSQSSSLLEPKKHLNYAPYVLFNNKIDVEVTTIDEWAKQNKIEKIDFIWLDLQGMEYQALKASPKILSTVKAILLEVEFVEAYKGQMLFKDIKKWLESQNFKMVALNYKPVWFGDALFVRD